MGHIIPKLNLNRNPELVDNYGLVCAKNIRLLQDGTIGPDTAEVNLNIQTLLNSLLQTSGVIYKIVGVIPYNTCFYLFVVNGDNSYIVKYDEKTNDVEECNCSWHSHYTDANPTKINGVVTNNLTDNIILSFGEYYENFDKDNDELIPLKHINLKISSNTDDESVYTQSPTIPITNLTFINYYSGVILPGVYIFYIRYFISDNIYTPWFRCSLPMFTGFKENTYTEQGHIIGVNVDKNSNDCFILKVEHLYETNNYIKYQIGFTHSDNTSGVVARGWKTFDINTDIIYFDGDRNFVEELDIADLQYTNFDLYNVKNITSFKNKLYISNYIESDLNPDLSEYCSSIQINFRPMYYNNIITIGANLYTPIILLSINKIIGLSDLESQQEQHKVNNILTQYIQNVEISTTRPISEQELDSEIDIMLSLSYSRLELVTDITELSRYSNIDEGYFTGFYNGDTFIDFHSFEMASFDEESFNDGELYIDYQGVNELYCSFNGGNTWTNVTTLELGYKASNDTVYRYKIDCSILGEYMSNTGHVTTLLPYQNYDFYIHFVEKSGIVTNGQKIGSLFVNPSNKTDIENHAAFVPTFTFSSGLPEPYVACFISISKFKEKVIELHNSHTSYTNYYDALELDLLLESQQNGFIYGVNNQILAEGKYYGGYDSNNWFCFGSTSKLYANTSNGMFLKVPSDESLYEPKLIKCTNYFVPSTTNPYTGVMNLLGYICKVAKPTKGEFKYYVAGNDIYIKNDITTELTSGGDSIIDDTAKDTIYYIYSNYNLNYISKNIDITPKVIRNHLRNIIDSGNLYQLYVLNSLYKTYGDTYYTNIKKGIVKFDNVIRSSNILQNEADYIIYKFDSTDYYTVPTNKGSIVNLKSVGNSIIVHTLDSLFMFKGGNTISAQGGEQIQLKENEVFDTGVTEVFGSEYGFGGIQKQYHQIVSENGYLFYDSDSNNIYIYQDNQQINVMSDNIKKLLNNVTDVRFANDYYNNRFFIKLTYPNNNNIILSYNVKTKSFISLHDINFDYAFNSKTLCYLVKDNNIYRKEVVYNSTNVLTQPLYDNKDIFPIYTNDIKTLAKPYIDVICNNDYDNVKILDYVSWICKKVLNPYKGIQTNEFVVEDDNSQLEKMNVAEEDEIDYPAQGILIYSNLTAKGTTYFKFNTVAELDAILKENRRLYAEQGLYDATGGTYGSLKPRDMPYFQLGHWNYNGFRNDLDNDDVTRTNSYSDNKSLLYGNYFVVRLIFDVGVNFKLKDLMFAINNGYETRR